MITGVSLHHHPSGRMELLGTDVRDLAMEASAAGLTVHQYAAMKIAEAGHALPPPRRATGDGWIHRGQIQLDGMPAEVWHSRRLQVFSQSAITKLPRTDEIGPTWIVSASRLHTKRPPSRKDMMRVRSAFGMHGADEDNHMPGISRILFMPVAEDARVECECKAEETVINGPDFAWTTPADGPCRGCELQAATGQVCPIHGGRRRSLPKWRR